MAEHAYSTSLRWTGDRGEGTADYRAYGREHVVTAAGKPDLAGSADPAFRGNADRWNPEELLVAALSSCHMLMYLHLCADAGVAVTGYEDDARGVMVMAADGGGDFREVVLRPRVTFSGAAPSAEVLADLHHHAHEGCFIANSVKTEVRVEPA